VSEFEKLLKDNLVFLERYVKFKVNNRFDAEDIIQEVCLTAMEKFDSLRNVTLFKGWIIGIANHKCIDHYRRKAKEMNISLDALSELTLSSNKFGIVYRNIVTETLDSLGDKERQILYLYFFKDMSQEEISRMLSIPVGTVKSRLHYAKEKFKLHYPNKDISKGETDMKKLPEYLPKYKITPSDKPIFPVIFEELPNWFIIPKQGEEITWASYDMPGRKITEKVNSKVTSSAFIHGVEGVEIVTEFEDRFARKKKDPHIYYAQLTDTHCRWLGESYIDKNGAKRLLTFLDGDEFISEWGYGEDNCGFDTHLSSRNIINRSGNNVTVLSDTHVADVVGRYSIEMGKAVYDTVCLIEYFDDGALIEQYLDEHGRTILWRRYNRDDWAIDRYKKPWSEQLPENDRLIVNGTTYVHWYDCITDHIL